MLDKPIQEIITDEDGKFVGVRSGEEIAKAKQLIGDPSYFGAGEVSESGKVWVVENEKVVRAICFLNHPIPGTDNSDSCQIIIPQNQVGRKHGRDPTSFSDNLRCSPHLYRLDIYIAMVSSTHNVCSKDVYIAIVSTIVETKNPEAELEHGIKLLGPVFDK